MTSGVGDLTKLETLRAILARLRGPEGCPWDREQTPQSLRRALLEECYESLEALDSGDEKRLVEELGDLLIHIAFHCQMGEERGAFRWEDVLRQVNTKLIRRHPHVFGDAQAHTARQVEEQWERIKKAEKPQASLLDGLPKDLPALAAAQAISQRVARVGFEWPTLESLLQKVHEELAEVQKASTPQEREREVGDLLFTIVNLARWLGVDAESALRTANARFRRRWQAIEETCRTQGWDFSALPPEQKEVLWQRAKEAVG
ncbi:MAG: nucleoside triphosphate pyrophosphohydrolase [Dehalococcoidia bacterium]|nr:nucleoside triphosphate pyrophosphohydrolase [Dehalococcoidia bacterium]MDW8120077.1 nucleoside triphosphate pyrophosphohydrolase [Chloroflexota bacterium]